MVAEQQTLPHTDGQPESEREMPKQRSKHDSGGPALAVPAFVIGLFGILLLVHFLVPEPEDHARSSSTSPIHQNR
jgi:hypothetical protein